MNSFSFSNIKLLTIILTIIFILITNKNVNAQWIELNGIGLSQPASQIPTSVADAEKIVSFSEGSNLYLFQILLHPGRMKNGFFKYDTQTEQWRLITGKLPNPQNPSESIQIGFAVNNEYYCGLGNDFGGGSDTIWKYDSISDNWNFKTIFPAGIRNGLTSFVLNEKVYILCGKDATHFTNELWEYNPTTNIWQQKNNFPGSGRYTFNKWENDTIAYIGLGNDLDTTSGLMQPQNDLWEYHYDTDSWIQLNNFPGSLSESYINFIQGSNLCLHSDSTFWIFDLTTDTWLQKSILDTLDLNDGVSFTFGLSSKTNGFIFNEVGLSNYNTISDSWSNKFVLNNITGEGFQLGSKVYAGNYNYDPLVDSFYIDTTGASWLFKCNNYGYANRNGNFEQYDPIGNVWSIRNPPPANVNVSFCLFDIGTSAYFLSPDTSSPAIYSIMEYNCILDNWIQKTSIPQPGPTVSFAIGNYGYFGLGEGPNGFEPTNEFYQYDPILDTVYRKGDFPGGGKLAKVSVGNSTTGFIGLGLQDPAGGTSASDGSIYVYNPSNDTWKVTPPLYARNNALSFIYNEEFYLGGGGDRTPCMSCAGSIKFFDLNKLDTSVVIPNVFSLSGRTFNDNNNNGIFDSLDTDIYIPITINPSPAKYSNWWSSDASYFYTVFDSVYTITSSIPSGYRLTTGPAVRNIILNGSNATNIDFGIYPDNLITGHTFIDLNNNSVYDSTDAAFNNIQVVINPSPINLLSNDGFYSSILVDSTYNISVIIPNGYHLTTTPASYNITLQGTTINNLDFGLYPDSALQTSVETFITSALPRCNTAVSYWLQGKNSGISAANGVLEFKPDSQLVFISSVPAPDSIDNGIYYWSYSGLAPFAFENLVSMSFQVPNGGSTLYSAINMNARDNLGNIIDTTSNSLSQLVLCSYDPNEKLSNPAENVPTDFNSWLTYTIYFQNTGNDTAFNIIIIDTLDSSLDLTTLEILESSHSYSVQMEDTFILKFTYSDILLPDSGVDLSGSQGYVTYRVKGLSGVSTNSQVSNTAYIYFDSNSGIATNTTLNTICQFETPTISISGNSMPICLNDTLLLTANITHGGITPSFQWKVNGIAVGVDDPIFITSSFNDGDTISCELISAYPCAFPALVRSNDIVLNTLVPIQPIISFNVGQLESTIAVSYLWFVNGLPIAGATNQTHVPLIIGSYEVMTIDSNGCTSVSVPYFVSSVDVSGPSSPGINVNLFPNPATNDALLTLTSIFSEIVQVSITSMVGEQSKILFQESVIKNKSIEIPLDTRQLEAGVYIVQILSGEKLMYVRFLVVK